MAQILLPISGFEAKGKGRTEIWWFEKKFLPCDKKTKLFTLKTELPIEEISALITT